MKLEGSCHCGAARFSVESDTPYPYNRCYCSICRKTAGGGGYAINIMGQSASLRVTGKENVAVYRAAGNERGHYAADGLSTAQRHFCNRCGSALWVFSPEYPDWVYPFASAIDTPLPVPPESTHLMLTHKASWVVADIGPHDARFELYPDTGIADWHRQRGLSSQT
ncbi:MAG: GFA family protein [Rhodospirillaceae bacterium]